MTDIGAQDPLPRDRSDEVIAGGEIVVESDQGGSVVEGPQDLVDLVATELVRLDSESKLDGLPDDLRNLVGPVGRPLTYTEVERLWNGDGSASART